MVDAGHGRLLTLIIEALQPHIPMYSQSFTPRAISHRGLHDQHAENSIPAFLAAIDAGATGIEIDVHASNDDVVFVHHDATIETGEGLVPIRAVESRDIARVRLAGDAVIPTLDDVLEVIGARAGVFIEVKGTGMEQSLARCLRRHPGNTDAYAVHSFDHRIVRRMAEINPSVRTGILQVSYLIDTCAAMRAAGATDLWQQADFIDLSLVQSIHTAGGRVIAWTPNTDPEWQRLTSLGVDGICTDRIDAFANWVLDSTGAPPDEPVAGLPAAGSASS